MTGRILSIMVAATVALTAGSTLAAGKAAKPLSVAEYSKEVKESFFKGAPNSSKLNKPDYDKAVNGILDYLKLPSHVNQRLRSIVAKGNGKIEILATIAAAKRYAEGLSKTNKEKAESLENAAEATALLLANSALTGARESVTLTKEQAAEASAALTKMVEEISEQMLTSFSKEEADSYVRVINTHNEIVNSGKPISSEDAFIQTIIQVKSTKDKTFTKDEALETVKKIKTCKV